MNLSELRANIYKIIDNVIRTGKSLDLERNGNTVRIQVVRSSKPKKKSLKWKKRDIIVGDPDDLSKISWASSWSEIAPRKK